MPIINWTSAFELTPAGGDAMSTVDDKINEFKEQVRTRLEQGGHAFSDDPFQAPDLAKHTLPSNTAIDGRHVVDSGGSGIGPDWYKADGTTKLVTVADTGATMVAGSDWAGGNVTTGNNPGHKHDTTMVVYLPAVAVGRVTGVIFHNSGEGTLTLLECLTVCWTAPGVATCTVDMHLLDNTYTDPTTTGAPDQGTIFTQVPVIASGGFDSAAGTPAVIATAALAVGEAWVFEIDANDTANDISVILKVRRG